MVYGGNANIQDFMDNFEDFDLKLAVKSSLYEYMMICRYKSSSSFFDL